MKADDFSHQPHISSCHKQSHHLFNQTGETHKIFNAFNSMTKMTMLAYETCIVLTSTITLQKIRVNKNKVQQKKNQNCHDNTDTGWCLWWKLWKDKYKDKDKDCFLPSWEWTLNTEQSKKVVLYRWINQLFLQFVIVVIFRRRPLAP